MYINEVPRIVKFIETESRREVAGAREGGERGVRAYWVEFLFWGDKEKVLEMDGCTIPWMYAMLVNCTLKSG